MDTVALFKEIMEDIEVNFLQETNTSMLKNEKNNFQDAILLYAKQHNLIKGTLLLLDNNMNEEAIVLARSTLNNYFLLSYILHDIDGTHLKEYHMQPLFSELKYWQDVKKNRKSSFWKSMEENGMAPDLSISFINKKIRYFKSEMKIKGYDSQKGKLLSVHKMTQNMSEGGCELYTTLYTKASKFEHSDVSSLNIYKERNNDKGFHLNIHNTDESLKKQILSIISISYTQSFRELLGEILKENIELTCYSEKKLRVLCIKLWNIIRGFKKNLDINRKRSFARPMRRFYQEYEIQQTVSVKLTGSHYCKLLSISDKNKRSFYEKEAINANWSVRELKRQINTSLYERLLLSKG